MAATRPTRPQVEATWELVLKRNPVERIKQEKAPLGIRDELPALIAAGYESVPEEDIVRLQWWGLYHDKPNFTDLPRKHKYTIAACADRCNAPEINCIALVGAVHEGREGFAVRVGGGLSSVPRLSRDMGVFVPKEEAVEVLAAITGAWSDDLRYRVSRVKARLKFMVDDIGPEGMRERVEARLGRTLEDYEQPPVEAPPHDHLGIHRQKQEGLVYIGVPVHPALSSAH